MQVQQLVVSERTQYLEKLQQEVEAKLNWVDKRLSEV
jgi:hypothetical protein